MKGKRIKEDLRMGKNMWLVDAEKLYDDLANDLKWIMGDGSNGEDLDTYACVGNTIRETFNDQEWYQGWIPISEKFPENNEEVLLSFENLETTAVGRYEEYEGGGAFYLSDDTITCSKHGMYVNAWMPFPEPYKGE
ncbi:DUF551 domain-containing protein [Firmicutes bacterium OM07-11]|nr:DUF551 domain-containing protein [Firmicutes bacterium OM07-11]